MIPFVGAGLSIPSGFLPWGQFLHLLRNHCDPPITEDELNEFLRNEGYEVAAQRIIDQTVPLLFNERFEANCRMRSLAGVEGCVRLVPILFRGHGLTTNFDNVLELVYGAHGCAFNNVLKGMEVETWGAAALRNETMLLKIHGHATEPATRILTFAEYELAYADGCPQRHAMEQIVRNSCFLFMGCSLWRDRTLDLFHSIYSGANAPATRNYAILAMPDDERTRREREAFLAAKGILPIWYGDYRESRDRDFDHDLHVEAILVELIDRQGRIDELTVKPDEPYRLGGPA